jgi:hypothetical protein
MNDQTDSASTCSGYDRCEINILVLVDVKAHRGDADKRIKFNCVMDSRENCMEWKNRK